MLSDLCLSVCTVCLSVLSVMLVYFGQMVGRIKMKLGMVVGLCPGHCVRWGPSSPKRGTTPQFSAHVRCSQAAEWIKMPLDTEEGLVPGNSVLDGNPAPSPQKGAQQPPIFDQCIVVKRLYGSTCHLVHR